MRMLNEIQRGALPVGEFNSIDQRTTDTIYKQNHIRYYDEDHHRPEISLVDSLYYSNSQLTNQPLQ